MLSLFNLIKPSESTYSTTRRPRGHSCFIFCIYKMTPKQHDRTTLIYNVHIDIDSFTIIRGTCPGEGVLNSPGNSTGAAAPS